MAKCNRDTIMAKSNEEVRNFIAVVEGEWDAESLAAIKDMCAEMKVHFHKVGSDITSNMAYNRSNIVAQLTEHVRQYIGEAKIQPGSLVGIMHVMDTDGAYIPQENVLEDPEAPEHGIIYGEDCMRCRYPQVTRWRNERKGQLMERLSGLPHLTLERRRIPYQCYYMSRNLEHVLYGNADNLTRKEKARLASGGEPWKIDPVKLEALFLSSDVCVPGTYSETWNFIHEGMHSLERHSNMHFAFDFLRECAEPNATSENK